MSCNLRGARVLLVNPPTYPFDLRGESHAADRWKSERAMNFGLLVVASELTRAGAEVQILDQEENDDRNCQALQEHIHRFTPHVVGVGNISVYTYLGSRAALQVARSIDPSIATIIGGQNPRYFLEELLRPDSAADAVVVAEGEWCTVQWVANVLSGKRDEPVPGIRQPGNHRVGNWQPAPTVPLESTAFLLYDLYPRWRTFFPLVEESRGCPYICDFCANINFYNRRQRTKDPSILVAEVERACRMWGRMEGCPLVLMCSIYGTDFKKTTAFLTMMRKSSLQPRLLAALRVDSPWKYYVELMGNLFDQVHFGLESGSEEILARMLKTKNPDRYLDSARAAFRTFRGQGIHVAINFILGYLGETPATLAETKRFISENSEWIDSAWGGALVSYPGSPFADHWDELAAETGAELANVSPYCDLLRTYPIHPSRWFRFEEMARESLSLMKTLNNPRTFYEHYRWYPGPDPDGSRPAEFYPPGRFFELFLRSLDLEEVGFDASKLQRFLAEAV